MYLGPCAVGCNGEAKPSVRENGLKRGKQVFCGDVCCSQSVWRATIYNAAPSPDSPNLETEASAW